MFIYIDENHVLDKYKNPNGERSAWTVPLSESETAEWLAYLSKSLELGIISKEEYDKYIKETK